MELADWLNNPKTQKNSLKMVFSIMFSRIFGARVPFLLYANCRCHRIRGTGTTEARVSRLDLRDLGIACFVFDLCNFFVA